MLAWVHQAVASENELLGQLMSSDTAPHASTPGSSIISTPELLDKVPPATEPLRSRAAALP